MATAVSTSAWANDVKAGLPSSQARITLFRRGSSAICLSPRHARPLYDRAEHMEQPAAGAIGISPSFPPGFIASPACMRGFRRESELADRPLRGPPSQAGREKDTSP